MSQFCWLPTRLTSGDSQDASRATGKPGYHLGTVVVVAAAGAICLSPVVMLALILGGVSVAFDRRIPTVALEHTGFILALGCVLSIVSYGVFRYIAHRAMRKVEQRAAWLSDRAAEIESHMDFHATHGDHLIITVSGEDAEKQWPEIERRLWEWKRARDG